MRLIYVLRHGETDCNRSGILQGQIDTKLNFTGVCQMARLARALSFVDWQEAYCSPLMRAKQSHEILHRKRTHVPCHTLYELAEMCFGSLQGRSRAELEVEYPTIMGHWQCDPWSARFPEGETLADVDFRVGNVLNRLASECDDKAVLISAHGVVNRLIVLRLLGMDRTHFWSLDVRNASLAAIDVEKRTMERLFVAGA